MRWTEAELRDFLARRGQQPAAAPAAVSAEHVKGLPESEPDEETIHRAVVQHLEALALPGVFWWHTPNGGHRNRAVAGKLKALGTKAGVPDLTLLIAGTFCGLELKTRRGTLSGAQKETRTAIERAGGMWAMARSVDEAVRVLTDWGALRPKTGVRTMKQADIDRLRPGEQLVTEYGAVIEIREAPQDDDDFPLPPPAEGEDRELTEEDEVRCGETLAALEMLLGYRVS